MDGFADTIEGALYLLAFLDDPAAADWVDEEAGRLLAYGRPDGFATRMYLDGNFARTMLLYAQWKAAGILLGPWRSDVRVGAERDGVGWRIAVQADAPWRGVLRFDGPRHRETLHLSENYPRLNAWPEWFPVEADVDYAFDDVDAGTRTIRHGEQLRDGVALELAAGATLHWRVTPVSPSMANRGRYRKSRE